MPPCRDEEEKEREFVTCFAVSARGELLALGYEDGSVQIWDTRTIAARALRLSSQNTRARSSSSSSL